MFVVGCIALIKELSYNYNRTMNAKLCLVFVFVAVSTCYGQISLSSTGAFSRPECPSANEQCLLGLCRKEDPSKFECQALSCKVNSFGKGISKKENTLSCVRQLCRSSSHSVCSGIRNCDQQNVGPTGKSKFIICIAKLFPSN